MKLLGVARWLAEIAGIALLALGGGLAWLPLAVIMPGLYLIILANTNEID